MIEVKTPDKSGEGSEFAATVDGLVGRDLDAAIARRIFGWKSWTNSSVNAPFFMSPHDRKLPHMQKYDLVEVESGNEENAPRYSSDIAAAMEVVEKVAAPGIHFMCDYLIQRNGEKRWFVQFLRDGLTDGLHNQWIEAPTLPEGICRAALAAIEDKEEVNKTEVGDA